MPPDWIHDGGLDEADKIVGLRHARVAATADVDDASALAVGALVIGLLAHDMDAALNAIERAVSVNLSSAAACFHGAYLYGLWAHLVTATSYAQRALRRSPFDPLAYHAHMALTFAAVLEKRYDEAAAHGAKLAQASPNLSEHVITYAAALALAGRMEEAQRVYARVLELEPSLSMSLARSLGAAPELAEKFEPARRLLGVPE